MLVEMGKNLKKFSGNGIRIGLLAGVALTLVACSEAQDVSEASGEADSSTVQVTNDATAEATKIDNITTSAADVPPSDGDVDMAEVLKASPLKEMELGDANAPVTIVEYMSMTCPHCANFHARTFKEIEKKYIETGKVRFILREFPFDPRAAAAIMLARCAPEEQFFPMVDMFFQQQSSWSRAEDARAELLKLTKLAGFTQETFNTCLTNQQLLDDVTEVRNRGANDYGIQSTPSFIVNGKRYSGDMSVESMSALIDSFL
ncbi:DsbA family protein [Lentilitoribacter sp. EG35]|jgi:protein-disulfide isomerase|uniref:DsbA family protein n=2 Tax=unclassified Lentilitoribacter TaxID=2647570 RepID=UPI001FCEC3F9|nr:DsbA family protein [Lentilitoribacter sp. Alg239-R112]